MSTTDSTPTGVLSSFSFANVESWLSNNPAVNSAVGEITTYAKTFTREIGVYKNNSLPNYTFYNLRTVEDQSGTLAKVKLPGDIVTKMSLLVNWLYNKVISTAGEIYADVLLTEMMEYAATIQVSNIEFGTIRQYDGFWMVDWLSFSSDDYTATNTHKVWFAIQALYDEYSFYEIVVVPPLTPLDQFFTTGANVQALIAAITIPERDNQIQLAKSGNPETIIRSDNYDYINPLNSSHKVSTNWPVLIYGPAGNNIDAIKDALIDYILSNSTHTREEWTTIFPDIFKRTEFIIVPNWNKYSVENLTLQAGGIYSPTMNYNTALTLFKEVANQYLESHVDEHLCLMGNPYRSLLLSVVGSTDNRDQLFEIDEVFPDFINVSSQSVEFARMSQTTQDWALILQNLIVLAETMTASTTVPSGYMRVTRDGRMFAVKTYNNIQYLVATKETVENFAPSDNGGIDPTPTPS